MPNLKQANRDIPFVVLRVSNARAGTHHLHVTRVRLADVALIIAVCDGAFADIGHNFDVGVGVKIEAGMGRNLIVVQHSSPGTALEPALVDIERLNLRFQSRSRDPEFGRRAAWSGDPSPGFSQCRFDQFSFRRRNLLRENDSIPGIRINWTLR
jgi:hypothetical protein